jgi:hypothetical protein
VPDECEACAGDLDDDLDTDLDDLTALLASYGRCAGDPLYNELADLVDNNCVDLDDLTVLLADYGCDNF